ncbi:MAG: O-antigen ligase family protein [Opitutae bacterium]|nr:O-antigen ligase family protein [Opitutae bacterium]
MRPVFLPPSLSAAEAGARNAAPIHVTEGALTAVLVVWGCFQPWAFGTMHEWSQWLALALAIVAFALALVPRMLELRVGQGARRTAPWRVLVRLPALWLSAGLLLYVVVQSANPGWAYRQSSSHWWMERQSHIAWLPSGYTAPFTLMNEWRKLVIWCSPLLAGCAAWLGITRRRTSVFLLGAILVNGTLVALLGIAQKFFHAPGIYWRVVFPNTENFGSFVYRNHAAAYLLLILLLATGLSARAYLRGEARMRRSTPSPFLALLGVLCIAAIFYSASRLGTVLAVGALLLYGAAIIHQLRRQSGARVWLPVTFAIVVVVAVGWIAMTVMSADPRARLQTLVSGTDQFSLRGRIYAFEVTRRMIGDSPVFGVGAGGFRFMSPAYVGDFPEITHEVFLGERNAFYVRHWTLNESHSDFLQFTAEFGLVGGLAIAALLGCAMSAFASRARRAHPVALSGLVAVTATLLYATCDFPFQNPAVVATLVLFLPLALRLADLEAPHATEDTSGPSVGNR